MKAHTRALMQPMQAHTRALMQPMQAHTQPRMQPMRARAHEQRGVIVVAVAAWIILGPRPTDAALPAYYGQVLSSTVGFLGGATADPEGSYVMGSGAALALEQQLKRVIGADPSLGLNITDVRGLPDFDLYRLLTLAAIGNFTTARASSWQQPVSVSVVPETGLFVINGDAASSDAALRVLLLIMCAVMFKRWMEDNARAPAGAQPGTQAGAQPGTEKNQAKQE